MLGHKVGLLQILRSKVFKEGAYKKGIVFQDLLRSLPKPERVIYESEESKIFTELQKMLEHVQKEYPLSLRWRVEHYEASPPWRFPWNCLSVSGSQEEPGRKLDHYDCDFGVRYFLPDHR